MEIHTLPETRDKAYAGLPIFFKLICKFIENLKFGNLSFHLPDGRILHFQGTQELSVHGIIEVHDFSFARRAFFGGDIGFFESYTDEQWTTPDLSTCLYVFAKNVDQIQEAFHGVPFISALDSFRHAFNKNTKTGSKRNIMAHYDLGNAFYEKWLDQTMTYSSARYEDPTAALSQAQLSKYKLLASKIDLNPDETVLEIGSGWGGFAEFAAKDIGANVVGITLSPSQYDYACERIFREGLNEKVEFRLQDYRDVDDKFDKVASIEMFEAVGEQYWQAYFDKVCSVLKPGGTAGLQIITISDDLFEDYHRSTDFIQRYVFPGGMLPSPEILKQHIQKAGLTFQSVNEFGLDYAKTLNEWHQQFLNAWEDIKPLGFDERFKKLWQFYLAYCEAGFRAGTTNVCQLALKRT